jgi:Golgi SNAP receptor complex protein 1
MSAGDVSELKRTLTSLERQVDSKITHYAAYADSLESGSGASGVSSAEAASGWDTDDEVNSSGHMRSEIERLLDQLRELNRALAADKAGVAHSVTQQHWGRLNTYTQDFQRVRARVADVLNSQQLLRGHNARSGKRGGAGAHSGELQALMDEQDAARGAHRAADRVLAQAAAAHADLEAQNQRVASVSSRLVNIARSVPGLNSLMTRIRGRRERDRYVMAACIGTCITLILLYEIVL